MLTLSVDHYRERQRIRAMKPEKAIEIKKKYQYILQDASFPELIEADNMSIEALGRIIDWRNNNEEDLLWDLPGETED